MNEETIHDLVGVGFGPSNLSVAIAAREIAPELRVAFFERAETFAWHEGLMFDGAEMQVTFTKDLVTLRDPASQFTFLKYLQAKDRLSRFINLRTFYPTRVEFNDYYRWVADQLADVVTWGHEVVSVEPETDADDVRLLRVTVRSTATGEQTVVLTRNLVHAPGGHPVVPEGTRLGRRVWHASQTRGRLADVAPDVSAPYHFNIVGGGQTSADVFLHLRQTYPQARITHSLRSFGMQAEDDTHFVNEIFDPSSPDWFFGMDEGFRRTILSRYSLAAHSGVSLDLIPRIYRDFYEDEVSGTHALTLQRFAELVSTSEDADEAVATYRSLEDGVESTVSADAVIVCTGYDYPNPVPLLAGLDRWLSRDGEGRLVIDRDYTVRAAPGFEPRIFLQGYAEETHGFTEVLLSLMPLRAAEIVDGVLASGLPVEATA